MGPMFVEFKLRWLFLGLVCAVACIYFVRYINSHLSRDNKPNQFVHYFDEIAWKVRVGRAYDQGTRSSQFSKVTDDIRKEEVQLLEIHERIKNSSLILQTNQFSAEELDKLELQYKQLDARQKQELEKLKTLLEIQDKKIREWFRLSKGNRAKKSDSYKKKSTSELTAKVEFNDSYPAQAQQKKDYVIEGVDLNDIAFGIIGDRNKLYTWQLLAPKLHIFEVKQKQPINFLVTLRTLKIEHPDVKWYVVADDDVYISLMALSRALVNYDPNLPFLIGSHNCLGSHFRGQHGKPIKSSGYQGWVHGGPGIVYSHKLMQMMNLDCCLRYYSDRRNWMWRGVDDVVATGCAMDYWPSGRITHHPAFLPERPGSRTNWNRCECPLARNHCTLSRTQQVSHEELIISYHHVNSTHTAKLHQADLKRLEKRRPPSIELEQVEALNRLNSGRRKIFMPENLAQC